MTRQVVNIDDSIKARILELHENKHYNFSAITRKLIIEALDARQNKLTPEVIEPNIYKWSKQDIYSHLQNIILFLSNNQQKPIKSDIGEIASSFLVGLIEGNKDNNEEIAILSQALKLDILKLIQLRNMWIKNESFEIPE